MADAAQPDRAKPSNRMWDLVVPLSQSLGRVSTSHKKLKPSMTSRNLDRMAAQSVDWRMYYPLLSPESGFRQGWQVLMCFPLIWTGTIMPYSICFVDFRVTENGVSKSSEFDAIGWEACNWFVDIFFWCDLFLQFFCSYYDDRGDLVADPKVIVKKYLSGWFCFDVVACLPSEAFTVFLGKSSLNKITRLPRLYRLSRLSRLMRVGRIFKSMNVFRSSPFLQFAAETMQRSRVGAVFKNLLTLFFLAHFLGCLWYIVAAMESNAVEDSWLARRDLIDEDPLAHWLHSVYFVLTVFTTVGFGDIHPVTNAEVGFGMFLMLVGAVANSIIVSNVITVITSSNEMGDEMKLKSEAIKSYASSVELNDLKFEGHFQRFGEYSVRSKYTAAKAKHNLDSFDAQTIFDVVLMMPNEMRVSLMKRVFGGVLVNNMFVDISPQVDQEVVGLLASTYLCREPVEKDTILYKYGETAKSLYLVVKGVIAHVAVATDHGGIADPNLSDREAELSPYSCTVAGNFVGEMEMLFPQPRLSTIRAESEAEMLVLPQRGMIVLVSSFPQFHDNFKRAARRRESKRLRRLAQHKVARSVDWLAARYVQSFVRMLIIKRKSSSVLKAMKISSLWNRFVKNMLSRTSSKDVEDMPLPNQVPEEQTEGTSANEKDDVIAQAEIVLQETIPVGPVTRGPPVASTNASAEVPSKIAHKAPECLPAWALGMQKDLEKMDSNITALRGSAAELAKYQANMRQDQEEMRAMLQQMYFLFFSTDHKHVSLD